MASIWGRTVEEFASAAEAMRGADVVGDGGQRELSEPRESIDDLRALGARDRRDRSRVQGRRTAAVDQTQPEHAGPVAIADAALDAGADALVLVNTVLGLAIDVETRRPTLGNGGGGVSGPGILPVALRCVYECRAAFPDTPIVGVGGVSSGEDAVAMIMAGANAVEVGTATFANPRAPWMVQRRTGALARAPRRESSE